MSWLRDLVGDDPRYRRHLTYALVAGLILRVVLVALVWEDPPTGDSIGYHRLAYNVAHHGVFALEKVPPFTPTVVRAPLCSLVVAAPMAIFGDHLPAPLTLLAVANVAGALALALAIRRRLPKLSVPALYALLLVPFSPLLATRYLSEALVTAAISIAMAALLLPASRRTALVVGVSLGLAALGRDVTLPLIGLLPISAYALSRHEAVVFTRQHVAMSLLASALVIAPWTARNVSIGTPALVSKGLIGFNLWIGTWERSPTWMNNGVNPPPEAYDSPEQRTLLLAARSDAAATDKTYRAIAIDRWKTRPLATLATALRRFPYLWIGSRTEIYAFRPAIFARGAAGWKLLKVAAWGLNSLLLLLGAIGGALVFRQGGYLRLLLLPIAFTAAVYFPFHSTENRYSDPVLPLVIVLATIAAAAAWERFRRPAAAPDAPTEAGSGDSSPV